METWSQLKSNPTIREVRDRTRDPADPGLRGEWFIRFTTAAPIGH